MAKCEKLLQKAQDAPQNLRFSQLCTLAECWGFVFKRQKGSHVIYKHADLRLPRQFAMQNFQDEGDAKSYQVKQLLKAIRYIQSNHPNYP